MIANIEEIIAEYHARFPELIGQKHYNAPRGGGFRTIAVDDLCSSWNIRFDDTVICELCGEIFHADDERIENILQHHRTTCTYGVPIACMPVGLIGGVA